nr:EOG090X07J4 [Eurycercus lamellatus]
MAACALSARCFAALQLSRPRIQSFHQLKSCVRRIHLTTIQCKSEKPDKLMIRPTTFQTIEGDRSKETFLEAIKMYTNKPGPRRGHVEFIYSALKYMEEYGVHKDLQTYKQILDTLPKGQYIPTNMFQAEFMHYPKQQYCILDLLNQMEDNGVIPDAELELMLLNIFGRHSFPVKKLMRMSYWMPKFKNLSPWALPSQIPNETLEVAKLAIQRMCSVDPASEIEVFETKELADALDDTWIVSGQSAVQRELLAKLAEKQTVFVEGAFTLWLRKTSIHYFILRSDPVPLKEEEKRQRDEYDYDDVGTLRSRILGDENLTPKDIIISPSVHEQEEGTILAIAVTGNSSKDSLLSWIRLLERKNPHLANLTVLFATYSPLGETILSLESNAPSANQTKITDGSNI